MDPIHIDYVQTLVFRICRSSPPFLRDVPVICSYRENLGVVEKPGESSRQQGESGESNGELKTGASVFLFFCSGVLTFYPCPSRWFRRLLTSGASPVGALHLTRADG